MPPSEKSPLLPRVTAATISAFSLFDFGVHQVNKLAPLRTLVPEPVRDGLGNIGYSAAIAILAAALGEVVRLKTKNNLAATAIEFGGFVAIVSLNQIVESFAGNYQYLTDMSFGVGSGILMLLSTICLIQKSSTFLPVPQSPVAAVHS